MCKTRMIVDFPCESVQTVYGFGIQFSLVLIFFIKKDDRMGNR